MARLQSCWPLAARWRVSPGARTPGTKFSNRTGAKILPQVRRFTFADRGSRRQNELGNAARFSIDEKFRDEAYRKMTKIFLEHFAWLPVIQPYEDYGLQKHVDWMPNPNQQFEIRRFNFRFRRT